MDFAGMLAHERRKRAQELEKQKQVELAKEAMPASPPLTTTTAPPELICLQEAPATVWYCDAFLDAEESAHLEKAIRTQHQPSEWLVLTKRRLLNLGGTPHPDGMLAESLPQWMQSVLDRLAKVEVFSEGAPNQCLLNEYEAGQGIDPHLDGPLYHPRAAILSLGTSALLRFVHPQAGWGEKAEEVGAPAGDGGGEASASSRGTSGSGWPSRTVASVLMRPGSLVVFSDHAYEHLKHGVSDEPCEEVGEHTANRALVGASIGEQVQRGSRLSLTMRGVRKVAVEAGEFLQPEQQREVARRRTWWAQAISEKR